MQQKEHSKEEPIREGRLVAGKYQVIKRLAETKLSILYMAVRRNTDETVILKAPHLSSISKTAQESKNPGLESILRHAIYNEHTLLENLDYSGIPKTYGLHFESRVPVMAMEYVPSSLKRFFNNKQFLPRLADFIMQFADILDYLYRKGVVHGDIKPSNIMCNRNEIKLIDFNISSNRKSPFIYDGQKIIIGLPEWLHSMTEEYASPEVRKYKNPDAASDMYSFCRVLDRLIIDHKFNNEYPSIDTVPLDMEKKAVFGNVDRDRLIVFGELYEKYPTALCDIHKGCTNPLPEKRINPRELKNLGQKLLEESKFSIYQNI